MARGFLISRFALAAALAGGAATALLPAPAFAKEKPAKVVFSPEYTKAAAEVEKTLSEASKNPAVSAASAKAAAAKTPAERQAAAAEVDAALGGAAAKLQGARAAASTPTDKLSLGQMIYNLGTLESDPAQQHEGLAMMLGTGALPATDVGKIQYAAGVTAYQTGDYAEAAKYLRPAYDAGYRDASNQIGPLLADVYKRTNNSAAALEMTNKDLESARASGTKPSESTIRTALQAAYDAKNVQSAADLSADLVTNYPSPESWNSAISVVRSMTPLPPQDNLDLMRLMARTNSLTSRNEYIEYLQDADPRRLPGESLKLIDAGVASGKLKSTEIADYRQTASGRISADRASLPALERDARGGSANGNTVAGAADAFLSYDQPAKAEELYKIALAKPGVDKNRVLTRLGIAQADQSKYADAKQSFAQVTGPRAPMAKLWTVYVTSKSGTGAPVAASAP